MSKDTTVKTDRVGNVFHYRNGKLHREDGPAIEYTSGHRAWYRDDKLHRGMAPLSSVSTDTGHGTEMVYSTVRTAPLLSTLMDLGNGTVTGNFTVRMALR